MTLQLLHYEFPYIWGKFDFLFYQCGERAFYCYGESLLQQAVSSDSFRQEEKINVPGALWAPVLQRGYYWVQKKGGSPFSENRDFFASSRWKIGRRRITSLTLAAVTSCSVPDKVPIFGMQIVYNYGPMPWSYILWETGEVWPYDSRK